MPTVLVVEDNADHLTILRLTLEREGIRVLSAVNGLQGVEIARQHHPDLILLDLAMPVLDGFEVCKRLAKDATTRDTPIVMLTAIASPEDTKRALKAGAAAFIPKPFDPDHVAKVVNEHLASR